MSTTPGWKPTFWALGSPSLVLGTATRLPSDSSALAPGEVRNWGGPAHLGHAFDPNLCQGPSWPWQGRDMGVGARPVEETHLEAFFGGNEEHVEGLPSLEGNA